MNNRFYNLYSHGFARVAVAIPRCRIADPAYNVEQTLSLARQAASAGRGAGRLPGTGPVRLQLRRPVPPEGLARRLRGRLASHRRGIEQPAAGDGSGPAAAGQSPAVQLCGRGGRRARAGPGAEELPAELWRVLRIAPVLGRRMRRRRCDRTVRRAGAVRREPGVRGREPAAAALPRRDLRRRLGAGAAVLVRRAWPARRCW